MNTRYKRWLLLGVALSLSSLNAMDKVEFGEKSQSYTAKDPNSGLEVSICES